MGNYSKKTNIVLILWAAMIAARFQTSPAPCLRARVRIARLDVAIHDRALQRRVGVECGHVGGRCETHGAGLLWRGKGARCKVGGNWE